ncbi:MAG: hypothetical protein WDZ41_01670 [Candidatus Babeliales bacterium]
MKKIALVVMFFAFSGSYCQVFQKELQQQIYQIKQKLKKIEKDWPESKEREKIKEKIKALLVEYKKNWDALQKEFDAVKPIKSQINKLNQKIVLLEFETPELKEPAKTKKINELKKQIKTLENITRSASSKTITELKIESARLTKELQNRFAPLSKQSDETIEKLKKRELTDPEATELRKKLDELYKQLKKIE